MDKLSWIRELVRAEQEMEESGLVDFSVGFDPEKHLFSETIHFLNDLKTGFVEAATAFNQLKGSSIGRVKIYGISRTHADFMLFRNGFKLIFSMKEPGLLSIRSQFAGAQLLGAAQPAEWNNVGEEDLLQARWGPFGDLIWTYHDQSIKIDYLIRYYLSRFIRESAK